MFSMRIDNWFSEYERSIRSRTATRVYGPEKSGAVLFNAIFRGQHLSTPGMKGYSLNLCHLCGQGRRKSDGLLTDIFAVPAR